MSGWQRGLCVATGLVYLSSVSSCRPSSSRLGEAALGSESGEAVELLMGDDLRTAGAVGAGAPELALAGIGIPGDSLGGFVALPEDACAFVLARGASGVQDVDVFAFADDGTVLGSDEAANRDANLLLCPPHASRAFVSTRVAAGFGLFGVTAQMIAPERAAELGQRFGVTPSQTTSARELDSNWPGLDERLAEHRRRLGGEWESLRKVALPLDPRLYVSVSTSVEADRCIDLLVTPSDEVAHIELEVLESSGRWIGSGQARGGDRNMMVCSSEPRELTIRCRPHAGRGLAALVISRSAPGAGRGLPSNTARYDLRPAGELQTIRQANSLRLQSTGYGRATLVQEGFLQPERRMSVPLPLQAGCSRIDVLTAAPLRSLRAWLWDARGQLTSEDTGGINATLFACGPATLARVDLETLSRGGAFSVEVRHSASMPQGAEQHRLGIARLLRLMDARGRLPSWSALPEVHVARVSETELARVSLQVAPGRCMEISAALDGGASGLEVRLLEASAPDAEAARVDDLPLGYGAHAASTRACAVKPARPRLLTAELRANVGAGIALWASHSFDPDPNLKGPQAR